ncbi:hypothetical protein Ae201684P_001300 [Aphanomyces euteiches]|uniref:Uncharacterized protein n=1 Tax=Aphanomyces euteiches TaxID=100861 RepID=A0A6G0WQ47_9STRA|nr:hypothetical protein Ae201684_012978 [Aphanomyces euteiches]KAH9097826.1 hypothetical protein Ae201684P_001300 [Aphanomyces euteiches]KAH9145259.1 hypothetical protein AeRB84_010842 [Aphanomyces euteiches]
MPVEHELIFLLPRITAFQQGIPGHALPFLNFATTKILAKKTSIEATYDFLIQLDQIMSPWYAMHGLRRLSSLCATFDFMVPFLAQHAAFAGWIQTLEYLDVHVNGFSFKHLVDFAALGGSINAIEWIFDNVEKEASEEEALDCVTSNAMDGAATFNRLDVLIYLHNMGLTCTTEAMDGAARHGHLRIVTFLQANRPEGCSNSALKDATAAGHGEVVLFLAKHRLGGCVAEAKQTAKQNNQRQVEFFLQDVLCKCNNCMTRSKRPLKMPSSPCHRPQKCMRLDQEA